MLDWGRMPEPQPSTENRPDSGPGSDPARYDAALADAIESKWQRFWDEHGTNRVANPGDEGFDASKPKFYALDMFPYPSGTGLHVGHPEGYTATDIISRYMKMKGANVLHPMGWDAFGLPAEQHAIDTGVHPEETTKRSIETFRRQLKRFGFCYDWSREFGTIDPEYYKWTQWIFLKIYNAWFDRDADGGRGRARPIHELVDEFESGAKRVTLNPDAAEYTGAGDLPGATDAGGWGSLDRETKKAIVDSYRLAYLSQQTVNWCPTLGTALANEEVIDGRSERGGHPVHRKPLRQWMFRITAYADRLLEGLGDLDWPSSTKTQQAEWIGRSFGAEIDFPILDADGREMGEALRVFTTRPDTIFGTTYMVVAPEHPLVDYALDAEPAGLDAERLRGYAAWSRNRTDVERQENKEKSGVDLRVRVRNPATGEPIPVWTSDYVLMSYGTGAIMAVPGQDQRDWDFASAMGLPIVRTVQPPDDFGGEAYTGDGPAINSGILDGLHIEDAKARIIDWLAERKAGAPKVNYKLRDWLFSRQRYWGEPFPVVFDERGDHHPVSEDALPVMLPELADYAPVESDDPQPLLAKATQWVSTTAGEAGAEGLDPDAPVRRETNTMPGWAGSCWYYLRYCDPWNPEQIASEEAESYWLGARGVDLYIGGAEHAVLHLLYARFWHMCLHDLGYVTAPEPFRKLYHQGLITSFAYQRADKTLVPVDRVEEADDGRFVETATGETVAQITAKMSKSLKNVVNPDDVIAEYGADTFRLYEMYMGPLDASKPWNTRDIVGLYRLLQRIWRLCVEPDGRARLAPERDEPSERALHRLIAKAGGDIERLSFNTAIASIFGFMNTTATLTEDQYDRFARVLAPFVPHMAEELWSRLGREPSVTHEPWPGYDEAMLVDDEIEIPVQVMGKLRSKVMLPKDADEAAMREAALGDPRIAELIEGKTVRKVVVVPGRLVNIVAN